MRVLVSCAQCLEFDGLNVKVEVRELSNSGHYELTCERGHQSRTVLQQAQYEVLFQIAAHAIADGYYREAITSFAASLESFYRFAILALYADRGRAEECKALLNTVHLSERQFGAFYALYHWAIGEPPTCLSNMSVKFRNEVVHKGTLPEKHEALAFGEEVLTAIRANLLRLKSACPEGLSVARVRHLAEAQHDGVRTATVFMPFILTGDIPENHTLRAEMQKLPASAWWMQKAATQ